MLNTVCPYSILVAERETKYVCNSPTQYAGAVSDQTALTRRAMHLLLILLQPSLSIDNGVVF